MDAGSFNRMRQRTHPSFGGDWRRFSQIPTGRFISRVQESVFVGVNLWFTSTGCYGGLENYTLLGGKSSFRLSCLIVPTYQSPMRTAPIVLLVLSLLFSGCAMEYLPVHMDDLPAGSQIW